MPDRRRLRVPVGRHDRELHGRDRRRASRSSTPVWASKRRTTRRSSTRCTTGRRRTSSRRRRTSTTSAASRTSASRARATSRRPTTRGVKPTTLASRVRVPTRSTCGSAISVGARRGSSSSIRARCSTRIAPRPTSGSTTGSRWESATSRSSASPRRVARPSTRASCGFRSTAICFISNLVGPMFPHFPNFNTLRGDKYRFVEPYLESVRTVRALKPEILVTGRNEPIRGAALDRRLPRSAPRRGRLRAPGHARRHQRRHRHLHAHARDRVCPTTSVLVRSTGA